MSPFRYTLSTPNERWIQIPGSFPDQIVLNSSFSLVNPINNNFRIQYVNNTLRLGTVIGTVCLIKWKQSYQFKYIAELDHYG